MRLVPGGRPADFAGRSFSDRALLPGETLSRVAPYLSKYGITRVARHTGLDCIGIPVWCAYTPNSRSLVIAQGKGVTDEDARASATMEALERVVAGDPDIVAQATSLRSLQEQGEIALDLPGFIAAGQSDLGPDDVLEWVRGRDLFTGGTVHVPLQAVLLDRTRENCRYWMSSDGLASGNTYEEAVLHGLLERVERDAVMLSQVMPGHRRNSLQRDPRAFGDPALNDMIERIEQAGLVLRLFDITCDTGIACFSALLAPADVLRNPHIRFVEVTGGSGAHPVPLRAAMRAVLEAVQSRLTYISGARDDITAETFRRLLSQETRQAFAVEVPAVSVASGGAVSSGAASLLDHTLSRLSAAGTGMAVAVTLSSPSLPFCVVKIVAPELEHPEGARVRRFGARALSAALRA